MPQWPTVTSTPIVRALALWQNFLMLQPNLPIPHEQRKIDQLLIALSKKQPVSAKPAPIAHGQTATGTAHPRVFFST